MPYYKLPKIGNNKISSNGNRYCIIEILESAGFEGFQRSDADYIYFDKKHGAPAAVINKIENKNYKLIVLMQVDATKIFRSLEDIEKNGGKFVHSSLRTIMGK